VRVKPVSDLELAGAIAREFHGEAPDFANLDDVAGVATAILARLGIEHTVASDLDNGANLFTVAPRPEPVWETIGVCGVDAGTLMIGDPCYFFDKDCEAQRKDGWSAVLREAYAAGDFAKPFGAAPIAYVKGHEGLAVLVNVDGDGTYSIQARRNSRGQIVEVRFCTGAHDDQPAAPTPSGDN
jgi:hypothetical protein